MRTLLTACTTALLLCATHASADNFPSKPVKVIVTFTVGGAADLTARLIGDRLADLWKQQVVVENRIGAGGRIGVEAVHRSPATHCSSFPIRTSSTRRSTRTRASTC